MFRPIKYMFKKLELLARSESGMTLPLLAISLVALTGFAGVAIDVGRVQMVQSKLQFAVDAAGLAAGATISTANADSEFTKYLKTNFSCMPNTDVPICYMGSTLTGHTVVTDNTNTIFTLSATATVPTTFMAIVGVNTVTVTADSEVSRAVTGLELVFVLDVTGSMNSTTGYSITKLQALKNASTTLISTLFGGAAESTNGKLWVGIVPFSQAVNIGASHANWLNPNYVYDSTADTTETLDWGTGTLGTGWGGCVDARQGGLDTTDDTPIVSSPSSQFGAYYWTSDNYNTDAWAGGNNEWKYKRECQDEFRRCRISNGNCSTVRGSCSTQWGTYTCTPLGTEWCFNTLNCTGTYNSCEPVQAYVSPLNATDQGPNLYCPPEVTRLTNVSTSLTTAINAMTAQGNTEINEGLVWGWRMLSPRWRGYWGGEMDGNSLPLDYHSRGMAKAVVLLTDGVNTISNNSHGSYWFLGSGRTGSTSGSTAVSLLDYKTLAVCQSMKDQGIFVYTIGLGPSSGINTTLLRNCATSLNYYFLSPTTAELETVFATIGDSLSNLRVSQ